MNVHHLIIANSPNDFTGLSPTESRRRDLDLAAFQELWLARPGDVIVTPQPLPTAFVRHVSCLLGMPPDSVLMLSPISQPGESLPVALQRTGLLEELRHRTRETGRWRIRACALDRPLWQFAEDLELLVEGFSDPMSTTLVDYIYGLNTKSGFREIAAELGLPTAPGFECSSPYDVLRALAATLERHDEALVKRDVGTAGSSQVRVSRADLTLRGLRRIERWLGDPRLTSPFSVVVEARLQLTIEPTIDLEVRGGGPRLLPIGNMSVAEGRFVGMDVPARHLTLEAAQQLRSAAEILAWQLWGRGFRGFLDLDAGVDHAGKLYVFEANVRRTSTSPWEDILARLLGTGRAGAAWRMGSVTFPSEETLLRYLRPGPDRHAQTVDRTLALGTWDSGSDCRTRYVIAGSSWEEVNRSSAEFLAQTSRRQARPYERSPVTSESNRCVLCQRFFGCASRGEYDNRY